MSSMDIAASFGQPRLDGDASSPSDDHRRGDTCTRLAAVRRRAQFGGTRPRGRGGAAPSCALAVGIIGAGQPAVVGVLLASVRAADRVRCAHSELMFCAGPAQDLRRTVGMPAQRACGARERTGARSGSYAGACTLGSLGSRPGGCQRAARRSLLCAVRHRSNAGAPARAANGAAEVALPHGKFGRGPGTTCERSRARRERQTRPESPRRAVGASDVCQAEGRRAAVRPPWAR